MLCKYLHISLFIEAYDVMGLDRTPTFHTWRANRHARDSNTLNVWPEQ